MMAAEMAVIRLTHVADLPSPEELIRKLQSQPRPQPPVGGGGAPAGSGGGSGSGSGGGYGGGGYGGAGGSGGTVHAPQRGPAAGPARGPTMQGAAAAMAQAPEAALARFPSFDHVVELIRAMRDVKLLVEVETCLRLARYTPGRIEFEPAPGAPADLAARLAGRLQGWTQQRWGVSVVSTGGAPTIAEVRDAAVNAQRAEARGNPLVQAVLAAFPNARIAEIRTPEALAADAAVEALPEVEDEWDPFEDS